MSLVEDFEAKRAGTIDNVTLMRRLANHKGWIIPARMVEGRPAPLLQKRGEQLWMLAFADEAAFTEWKAGHEENSKTGDEVVKVAGTGVVQMIHPTLDGVTYVISGGRALHYNKEQLVPLRRLGLGVLTEQVLDGTAQVARAWDLLADYDGFVLARDRRGEQDQLLLVPNNEGKKLVAIFTNPDTVQAWQKATEGKIPFEPTFTRHSGRGLFDLMNRIDVDGMVFNPAGPVPARAVTKEFASKVLELATQKKADGADA